MTNIDFGALKALSADELAEIEAMLADVERYRRENKLEVFEPYPVQREFIALGSRFKQRLLLAGNQLGKSETGAYEIACHLTGLYPPDWTGRKFTGPTVWWAAGVSTTAVRDIQQAKLCGEPGSDEEFGTGFIPKHCFVGKPTLARGAVANSYDTLQVRHSSGGISTLQFKSYEQGRPKFQGKTLTGGLWWDEEPPEDVYLEGEQRMNATDGISIMTFTPLMGLTKVVARYLEEPGPNRTSLKFRADQCPHMTPERIQDVKEKNPTHEWEARLNGEPKMGSGAIFLTPEEQIKFPVSQRIPDHWPKLWGIDFGISHPFAAVLAAWDREADVIYLLHSYKASDALPIIHAEAIRAIGAAVPVAWPHDGHQREKGTGESLAKVYKALDLKMLETHAHWPDGGISTEAAVLEMQQRFASGRLRVKEDLEDFFVEYRGYHRKLTQDGQSVIVKIRDDLLSATMKVIMMKRRARIVELGWTPRPNKQQLQQQRLVTRPDTSPWFDRRRR